MKTQPNASCAPGSTNIFRAVKEAVPLPEAAALYGLRENGSHMVRCPFHDDHNPSLRLYEDHYYCFGCHSHGDAVDLVARLTNLRPIDAARLLAAQFHVSFL